MAQHYGREMDLIHLQIRGPDAADAWIPPHRFNLTGDRGIPFTTYAKYVVDTATSLGQGGDKRFFKSQAQTHIAHALEMLHEMRRPVTLAGAFELLCIRQCAFALLSCTAADCFVEKLSGRGVDEREE